MFSRRSKVFLSQIFQLMIHKLDTLDAESEKDGEPRNQVPEEGLKVRKVDMKPSTFHLISIKFRIFG